ncbi:MAG TPA: hypothetical protein VGO52_05415 [Hyphomonadaceae bacterium]|jgi:hypothetical protein|nr:hypothetical protein [Hyphomonadaceae bacterium]
MKKLALIALIAFAAAPALAQTSKIEAAKTTPPKPVAEVTEPATVEITDATPLDVIVQEASEQDRAKMLMRCVGPPPKLAKEIAALKPASEPAAIIGGDVSGG